MHCRGCNAHLGWGTHLNAGPGGGNDLSVSCVMKKYGSEMQLAVRKRSGEVEKNLRGSLLMEKSMMDFCVAVHQ